MPASVNSVPFLPPFYEIVPPPWFPFFPAVWLGVLYLSFLLSLFFISTQLRGCSGISGFSRHVFLAFVPRLSAPLLPFFSFLALRCRTPGWLGAEVFECVSVGLMTAYPFFFSSCPAFLRGTPSFAISFHLPPSCTFGIPGQLFFKYPLTIMTQIPSSFYESRLIFPYAMSVPFLPLQCTRPFLRIVSPPMNPFLPSLPLRCDVVSFLLLLLFWDRFFPPLYRPFFAIFWPVLLFFHYPQPSLMSFSHYVSINFRH